MVEPLSFGESLGPGDEGEQVGELQRWLAHLGYYLGQVDERFGDATEQALREFQRLSGRAEDGRVDNETWEVLDVAVRAAGYGADAHPEQATGHGQLSEDGQWWWDGAEWHAVGEHAGEQAGTAEQAEPAAAAAGQLSEDGRWRWDGTDWRAVDDQRPAEAAQAVDVSKYPDLRMGESGEWVEYLDAMLASKGF